MSNLELVLQAVTERFSGSWRIDHAHVVAGDRQIYVLVSAVSNQCLVVRNDIRHSVLRNIDVPELGEMRVHFAIQDPAFGGLATALLPCDEARVLRYRPAKRITLSANHARWGRVVLKCVATGAGAIYERLAVVWAVQDALEFSVGEPLQLSCQEDLFIQRRMLGGPIDFVDVRDSALVAARMASAILSLHCSSAQFSETFGCAEQEDRTRRYLRRLARQQPSLAGLIALLKRRSLALATTLSQSMQHWVPIHGSLHGHQWLIHSGRLALVDFDRASMGHAELDVATFIAQWDFESGPLAEALQGAFLGAYERIAPTPLNQDLFSYYRAHKHISKAYKTSKKIGGAGVNGKIHRHLTNALRLLDVGVAV